jgi:site-specific recombinase XerD
MRTRPEQEKAPSGWGDAVERFLVSLAKDEKSAKTIRCYREELAAFETWFRYAIEEPPALGEVTADDLRQWKEWMIAGKLQPATVNKKRAALQSFFRWSEVKGFSVPVEFPKAVKKQEPGIRWLTRSEERAYVRAVERAGVSMHCALAKVLLHCGIRIEEAASLRWNAIEIGERKGEMTVIGKGRKEREIPINVEARNALQDWSAGSKLGTDRPVWEGQRGPLTVSALHRIVVHYAELAALPDVSAHCLRHTCGKRLIDSGSDINEVARILGHSDINTTRRYITAGKTDLQAAVERRASLETEPHDDDPAPRPPRRGRRA